MGRRKWSRADIRYLFDLRDVQKLSWRQIGEEVGDTGANCCTRYQYYKRVWGLEPRRREVRPAPAAPAAKAEAPKAARPAPEPIHRPRYFHEADADMAARIKRQGLTAGFLGDPPPGRSALDQKQSA